MTVHGVGLGPGAQDLMTVRADRLVRQARRVAFFRKKGRPGQARTIVEGMLHPEAEELPMEYPVTTEIPLSDPRYNAMLRAFYEEWADRLALGPDTVVLCEGDPFFYGSFMHLHTRLQGRVPVEVVPAVTGMSGGWTATGAPVTWGDDVLTVLMGTLPEGEIARRAEGTDALVVMKIGRNLSKVKRALEAAGRLEAAWMVERATMAGERVSMLRDAEAAPYFSLAVVHGQGRRP